MVDEFSTGKRAAGYAAADLVESGMRLGLGTGSTVAHLLDRLGQRVRDGLECAGVPTSRATEARARELGIPLLDLNEVSHLDLCIDGADEVDRDKHLLKGGGGALVREKIVAAAAREMIVVVSANKMVDSLGTTMPLPVEVLEFGWRHAASALEALGCKAAMRMAGEQPFRSDNGNYVLDCSFGSIRDPGALDARIAPIPGVVDSGLFIGMAGRILIGEADGTARRIA